MGKFNNEREMYNHMALRFGDYKYLISFIINVPFQVMNIASKIHPKRSIIVYDRMKLDSGDLSEKARTRVRRLRRHILQSFVPERHVSLVTH